MQGQLGIMEAMFHIDGLRAEWKANYGEEGQPNLAPRYGVSYTRDIGPLSAKLRASYGRSTRPPTETYKEAKSNTQGICFFFGGGTGASTSQYGEFDCQKANPELGPEHQQGGE